MKNKKCEFTIDFPWELTLFAYDEKMYLDFPIPEQPEILSMEFSDFHWNATTDVTTLTRKAKLKIPVPSFLMKSFTSETEMHCHFDETIDRGNRRMVTIMENTNLTEVVKIVETTTIIPHPDDPVNKTLMLTDCNMNLRSNFWGIGRIEAIIIKVYVNGLKSARVRDAKKINATRTELEEQGKEITALISRSEVEAREIMEEEHQRTAAMETIQQEGEEYDEEYYDDDDDDEFYDAESDDEGGRFTAENVESDEHGAQSLPEEMNQQQQLPKKKATPTAMSSDDGDEVVVPKTKSSKKITPAQDMTLVSVPIISDSDSDDDDESHPQMLMGDEDVDEDTPDNTPNKEAVVGDSSAPLAAPDTFEDWLNSDDPLPSKDAPDLSADLRDFLKQNQDKIESLTLEPPAIELESADDMLDATNDDVEEDEPKGKPQSKVRARLRKAGVTSLWAAGVAAKVAGRTALKGAAIAKRQGWKAATKVKTKAQTIRRRSSTKLKDENATPDGKVLRSDAYNDSMQKAYTWLNHRDSSTVEFETAMLARRLQMEADWRHHDKRSDEDVTDADKEETEEYDALLLELDKLTQRKLGLDDIDNEPTSAAAILGVAVGLGLEQTSRLELLETYTDAILRMYANAEASEIEQGKHALATLISELGSVPADMPASPSRKKKEIKPESKQQPTANNNNHSDNDNNNNTNSDNNNNSNNNDNGTNNNDNGTNNTSIATLHIPESPKTTKRQARKLAKKQASNGNNSNSTSTSNSSSNSSSSSSNNSSSSSSNNNSSSSNDTSDVPAEGAKAKKKKEGRKSTKKHAANNNNSKNSNSDNDNNKNNSDNDTTNNDNNNSNNNHNNNNNNNNNNNATDLPSDSSPPSSS